MAAGLWIYAATIVRFIMDPENLPRQQPEDILARRMQSSTKSNVTVESDAFYKLIMDHISPKHHLPIVQQSLLIYHTTSEAALHTLSNILGLTLDELKNAFSDHHFVLTSTRISFYDASFMEFLLDKTRSGEYWLEDHRHYTALATKVLRLFKALYAMNGISRGMSSFPGDISCCE